MTGRDPRALPDDDADRAPRGRVRANAGPRVGAGGRGRVLLVAPQPFFAERGTPIAVRYVLEALSQLGFETDILTLPLGDDVAIPGVRVIRIANPLGIRSVPVGLSPQKLIFDGLMLIALARQLRRHDYVCVHAVEEGALLGLLARTGRGTPLIYDMASSLPEQLAQKPLFRLVALQALFRRIEAGILRRVAVTVCSAGLARHVHGLVPDTPVLEWRFPAVADDVAPHEVAALRQELAIEPDAPVVLYTGNFAEYQGIRLLLDATPAVVRAMPRAVLVLVGAADRKEIDFVQASLDESSRAQVRCTLRQPRARIDAFLRMASAVVSPRAYGGNFPLKVFDYLAAGKPIVATDVPTHRAVLDESMALLVEPTPTAIAEGILRVLRDQELAASLAAGARRFADRELSWSRFVALIDQLYALALESEATQVAEARGV
jgi:glycosyltransferase involved in cell wall biosynthesis